MVCNLQNEKEGYRSGRDWEGANRLAGCAQDSGSDLPQKTSGRFNVTRSKAGDKRRAVRKKKASNIQVESGDLGGEHGGDPVGNGLAMVPSFPSPQGTRGRGGFGQNAGMLICLIGSSFVIGQREQRLDADSRGGTSVNWDTPPGLFN